MMKMNERTPVVLPVTNLVSAEEFNKRVKLVFGTLESILVKTFGAYGAPTIILNYPYRHMTKDGYTVAKNIIMDPETDPLDRAIADMAVGICTRLNYTVGDGTTTAIVAVNKIYNAAENILMSSGIRPRDLMESFTKIRDIIIERLQSKAVPVTPENLSDVIRKVVHISSNSDKLITEFITKAYEEIGFPCIISETAPVGVTDYEIIDGFMINAHLGDEVYINNENKTARYKNSDVIIFDHMVVRETYDMIIKPLCNVCQHHKRHLICIAPAYDDVLLRGTIRNELNACYKMYGDIPLVIVGCSNKSDNDRKMLANLALVLNTVVIGREFEEDILKSVSNLKDVRDIFNVYGRNVEGMSTAAPIVTEHVLLNLGTCDSCDISYNKHSVFRNTVFDNELYNKAIDAAKTELEGAISKYAALGTYSAEVYDAQKRLASLNMKIAVIRVGGESDMSRDMVKDSVDDAIRAAESAYRFGYVKGCNLSLIETVEELLAETEEGINKDILKIISRAFKDVYAAVLSNAIPKNFIESLTNEFIAKDIVERNKRLLDTFNLDLSKHNGLQTIPELIVEKSLEEGKVYNLETEQYDDSVINSVKTDIEVLTASIDLLSILVTGNQILFSDPQYGSVRNRKGE